MPHQASDVAVQLVAVRGLVLSRTYGGQRKFSSLRTAPQVRPISSSELLAIVSILVYALQDTQQPLSELALHLSMHAAGMNTQHVSAGSIRQKMSFANSCVMSAEQDFIFYLF